MSGTNLRLSSGTIAWGAFKQVLDFHDIVIEQKTVVGATIFFAHLRRNFPARLGPPFEVVAADKLAGLGDQIVTATYRVENGAGNDIFATVRGLLVRDVNRI